MKMTGIKLELMTDVDMFQFIEMDCSVVFPILLTGMGKLIISICLVMTAVSPASILCTSTLIIFMAGYESMPANRWV